MSGDENGLPPGWVESSFGDLLLATQNGCSARQGSGEPTVVLRLADVSSTTGEIAKEGLRRVGLASTDQAKYALSQGDLLAFRVNGSKDIAGQVIEYKGTEGFAYCDHFIRMKVNSGVVTPTFVALAFGGQTVRRQVEHNMVSSAGQNTVSQGTMKDVRFALPPLNEQKRIVAKIEALQARSAAAKEALDAIPPLLEKFRQSVLAAAFRGELTKGWRAAHPEVEPASVPTPPRPSRYNSRSKRVVPGDYGLSIGKPDSVLPKGWAWKPLVDVAQMESGHTPSRRHPEYWDGDIPWVSIPDARDNHGRTINETRACVTQLGLDNSAARLLPKGSVFLCRTAASIGYTVILGRPMATSQDFVVWVPTSALDPRFLMWLLMAEKQAILRFGKGSTHKTVYFPELLSFHVALPPVEEQTQIVRAIESRMALADAVESKSANGAGLFERLNQSILAKAFRGELVPQDPSDEPASVLLERIKAEREAGGKAGKRGRG